jgi:hypothetical protein
VLDAFDRGFIYMSGCSLAAALTLLALAIRSRRWRAIATTPVTAAAGGAEQ